MATQMKNVVTMVMTTMMLVGMAAAASHIVGDSTGWTVPPTKSLYSTWAAKQSVKVGDSLVFNFATGKHTVAEVSKSDYDACTFTNTITTVSNGPSTMSVKTAGTHYYLCTVGPHCSLGQKVAVTVLAAAAATAPATTPSASPATSPSTAVMTPPTSAPTAMTPTSASPVSDMSPMGSSASGPSSTAAEPTAANSASGVGIGSGFVMFTAVLMTVFFH